MMIPASTTRNDASVNGLRCSRPTFPTMKLSDQHATMTAIALPNSSGGGRFCAGEVSLTGLGENLFAHGEFTNQLQAGREADAGAGGHAVGPVRRAFDFGFDDVGFPVAAAGGNVTGKRKIGQRRERNIVRATYAGFQHPAAPDRYLALLAEVVDAARRGVSAHAPKLNVDDPARAQFDCRARLLFAVDALVQADRCLQFFLQLDVAVDVVPTERLLDHHQVVGFELFQQRPVLLAISRVGIHHQPDARKLLAQPVDGLDVPARLDFDLDALVAGRKRPLHSLGQLLERVLDADGYAAGGRLARPTEHFPQRQALASRLGIPHGRLDAALSHVVAADPRQQLPDLGCALEFPALQGWPDKIAQDMPGGLSGFRSVVRGLSGDGFAPADHAVQVRLHQQDAPLGRDTEAGFEWRDQHHADFAQYDLPDLHLWLCPGGQEIIAAVCLECDGRSCVAAPQPVLELFPNLALHPQRPRRVMLSELADIRGHANRHDGFCPGQVHGYGVPRPLTEWRRLG